MSKVCFYNLFDFGLFLSILPKKRGQREALETGDELRISGVRLETVMHLASEYVRLRLPEQH